MTVQVGVIGTGAMGADHVRTIATHTSGAEVVAVSDTDGERASAVAAEFGVRTVHRAAQDVIDDRQVHAVVIASPDDTHCELVLGCIAAGKPVLCEKPLANTVDDCLRVVYREADAGRRLVQLGFMRRFDPGYLDMKRVLDAGEIGRPLLMHCVHRNPSSPPGFTAGTPMRSSVVHEIDAARWLLGTEIAEVGVHTPVRSALAPDGLPDPRLVLLRSTEDVLIDVEVFVNARYGYDVRCELVGETGTVSLAPPATTTVCGDGRETRTVTPDFRRHFAAAYRDELQSWVDSVAAGRPAGPSAWDGYVASAVAELCVAAADRPGPLRVELADEPGRYERKERA